MVLFPFCAAHLEVSALRLQPVVDEALGVSGEAEHELPLGLQLVDGLDGLMDLKIEKYTVTLKPLRTLLSKESYSTGRGSI